MIYLDTLGSISYERKVMFFSTLRNSKTWWKNKLGNTSKFLDLMRGENTNQDILINIAKVMGFYHNL